ncbi:Signal transduction histidine kinase [Rhizobium sp. NFR07]|uniref:hybrid sensor histidine kinase/response regulator n=1 Tax=Rhizobium sp. NFR07 TaxID=1566262 RepID=UPI0008ED8B49|nr:ATP-binding protein [Rhizobium sp. NFR07]SFA96677.1 Signal transduction histidine kinase [Rhizobium sp. NFR07]
MRTIADLQDLIAKAFAQPALKEPAELLRETVVAPPQVADLADYKGSSPLRNLILGLKRWPRSSLKDRLVASEAASAAKSRRIATVVHEVRTPLNGILGMTHLLSQTKLTAEQQNYLSGIRQSGHMLAQLVDDILDLSTMEAGRFRLNTRAENLRQLLESVVEMLSPRAHEKRIEIAATFAADLPELLDFDPARLRQVLFNVIGNAVKFTAEGGVLVKGSIIDGNVEIAVIDTGPGMTVEDQARIFGEFEQFGSPDSRSGGTGLGLSITSRILAEFGGSLSVRSRVGEGSVFTIRFPVQLAEDAPAGETDRSALLSRSRVILLAPQGPAAQATVATIEALGGRCRHLATSEELHLLIDRSTAGPMPFTDLIVDHRLAASYACEPLHKPLHRILLVNPEERASQPQELFDAWLIRPLREKSLVDVLSGRLRGFADAAAQAKAGGGRAHGMPEQAGGNPDKATLDIVLAEDDPISATLVRAMLQRDGHRVRWVADVPGFSDALDEADAHPDLIITDMNMPGGDPLDVLAALRLRETGSDTPSLPVIVLTGDSREEATRLALQAGVRKILQKPVNPGMLSEEIRAVVLDRNMQRQAR